MRIGGLARRTNVSVRALRYYEEQGLLVPQRRGNGYRDDDDAVGRVAQIQTLSAAGLCSSKIVQLLPRIRTEGQRLVAGPALIGELERECRRIQRQIDGSSVAANPAGHPACRP